MSKQLIHIVPPGGSASLPAPSFLANLRPGSSFHEQRDIRHPLGIYNISVMRICKKVSRCGARLETFWQVEGDDRSISEEIVDYMELVLYAAAEHVDDLERIACVFYENDHQALRSRQVRKFKQVMKPLRGEVAKFANTIKHSHGRIRLFKMAFVHGKERCTALGFYVEGFKDGVVAPHPILHSGGKTIISVTSYLWNILTYVWEMSAALSDFLREIGAITPDQPEPKDSPTFRDAALKLARLPTYAFDDVHPFNRVTWRITVDEAMAEKANSRIYGSMTNQWDRHDRLQFGDVHHMFEPDGITKKFKLVAPRNLGLKHWD